MSTAADVTVDEWVVDQQVKEWLTCAICYDLLYQPVNLSTCSHTFCLRCLREHVKQPQSSSCPMCKTPLSSQIRSLLSTDDCINGSRNEQLRRVKVRCPHCRVWEGILGVDRVNLIAHRNECDEFPYQCGLKCGAMVPRSRCEEHDSAECPRRMVQCGRCAEWMFFELLQKHHINERECEKCHVCAAGCGEVVADRAVAAHRSQCAALPVECRLGCGQSISRIEIAAHEHDCLHRQVECERCKERLSYEHLSQHHINERECVNCHICMLGCGELLLDRSASDHRSNHCSHRSVLCPICCSSLEHRQLADHNETSSVSHIAELANHCTSLRQQVAGMQREIDTLRLQLSGSMASSDAVTAEQEAIARLRRNAAGPTESMRMIVSLMQKFPRSEMVQFTACQCVQSVIDSSRIPNHQPFIDAHGIESIVSAMEQHLSSAAVQEAACDTLTRLTDEDGLKRIAAAGGIECILQVMKRYHELTALHASACCVLHLLARNAVNRPRIVQADGIDCVLSSMRHHREVRLIQQEACGVLSLLALHPPYRALVEEAGGMELVWKELQKRPLILSELYCENENEAKRVRR